MTFDVNKAVEVEGMTAADFGVWKSAKQNEVIILIDSEIKFPIILIADQRLQFRGDVAARQNSDDARGRGLYRYCKHPPPDRYHGNLQPSSRILSREEK